VGSWKTSSQQSRQALLRSCNKDFTEVTASYEKLSGDMKIDHLLTKTRFSSGFRLENRVISGNVQIFKKFLTNSISMTAV
jgi:hypothetical protein